MHFKLEEPSNKNMIDVSNKGYVCKHMIILIIWCIGSIFDPFLSPTHQFLTRPSSLVLNCLSVECYLLYSLS